MKLKLFIALSLLKQHNNSRFPLPTTSHRAAAGPVCPVLCLDEFVGGSGTSPSASWTSITGAWKLTGAGTVQNTTGDAPGDMYWNANTFTANQYSQITVNGTISSGTNTFVAPAVRSGGGGSYYMFIVENANGLDGYMEVLSSGRWHRGNLRVLFVYHYGRHRGQADRDRHHAYRIHQRNGRSILFG